jgi:F0F1-type ATP synthase membrane subunit b/b'
MSLPAIFLLLAEGAAEESTWSHIYENYLNVPGFESWKFLNLLVFLGVLYYLLRKPVSEAFKARREAIRAELIRAEEEKQAALSRLKEIEARVARLEEEKSDILQRAKEEATADKKRESDAADLEIRRLRDQVESELMRLTKQTRAELRRFSAEESIRLAEEKLRTRIDNVKDAKLVKASIQEIGGLN